MKISKKLETKYIRSFKGEKELNYPLGYRGIEIKFTNRRDFISEQEGEEYLICLEMYLNNNDLALYEYDGSRSVIANLAEITFVVNENQIDEFTKVYKEFKANYETIINNYKHQVIHDEEEQETQEEITPVIDIKEYITAGHATITLEGKTNRFTYKIHKHNDSKIWFVQLLTGQDNEVDYKYIGFFREDLIFKSSAKSSISITATSFKAFEYFMRKIENLPENLKIHYSGKCPKCGKMLTTPESIIAGIGPECLKKLMEVG